MRPSPPTLPSAPLADKLAADANRRRHPRQLVCAPATVRCGEEIIEGFTDNLSYSGLLIQSLTGVPSVGDECLVVLDLPMGSVEARGCVVRLDRHERKFAVDLTHVDKNGEVLLVAVLMGGGDPRPERSRKAAAGK